ncbi:hypothetical protein [Microbulbifer sp. VAAF005]|uniref:hypothetical protein n=1 Tax=Microbulbifer sp. VAAF005 TaxID=3034230 RepID=UPI0024AE13C9|nr:hypothetical protein [Microbulbifer sp. VAAF005]WHI46580.1 hypothetical protein P0078_23215 [Microbulbifer sp. VAAF005]
MKNKKVISTTELQDLIQKWISSGAELDGDCKAVEIGEPQWHEPDGQGNNWDVPSFSGDAACEGLVASIINKFKEDYNVIEP